MMECVTIVAILLSAPFIVAAMFFAAYAGAAVFIRIGLRINPNLLKGYGSNGPLTPGH